MSITFTKNVAEHIQAKLAAQGSGLGMRIQISVRGCSGYYYDIDFATTLTADDMVFEEHGAKVIVAKKYLPLLSGTHIDYVPQGLNKKLTFDNPKAKAVCGCGESFTIDDV